MQWAVDGIPVCTAGSDQFDPAIVSDSGGGAIISWLDKRNGNADLYAQRVNASGTVQWTPDGLPVSTAAGDRVSPNLVSNGGGGAIITWYDSRNSGFYDIYAQNINPDGTLGCAPPVITGEPKAEQTVCKNSVATQLNVAATGDKLTYQWYTDNDNTGYNGTAISGETGSSFTPPSTAAGTTYYYVVVLNACGTVFSAYSTVMVQSPKVWYQDSDNDGYGNALVTQMACTQPVGYVPQAGDCNDAHEHIHPGITEVCNGIDDDCDGYIDEGFTKKNYYKDDDCDGYGDPKKCITTCDKCPKGYVPNNKDCNDRDRTIYPGAPELCDEKDNDCDGNVDEGITKKSYYKDEDCDGYGDPMKCLITCDKCPKGYVSNNKDCNDRDRAIYPGAREICDNKDNDCDGQVDEGFTKKSYYRDYDKDGYGDPKQCIVTCSPCPSGYVTNNKDCDDNKKSVHPGAAEIARNGIDDNCNGKIDERTGMARESNDETLSDDPDNLPGAGAILNVTVFPNPSPNHFTLNIKGASDQPVQLRVVDRAGKLVEAKNNVTAKAALTIGHSYGAGVYFVEVIQGSERVVLKCIKQ